VQDVNTDESDVLDETWVLWDRQVIDDELYGLWAQFDEGVRIVVCSDSCHSGTVSKVLTARAYRAAVTGMTDARGPGVAERPRSLPLEVQRENEASQASLYRTVQWLSGAKSDQTIRASVLLLSGCMENQLSYDGPRNGRFTGELLTTWAGGAFRGDYRQLHRDILDRMPPDQSPNYFFIGASSPAFERQKPFTIAAPDGSGSGGGSSPVPAPQQRPTLRRGDRGGDVTYLQNRLRAHGYDVVVDGYFGPQCGSMVRALQAAAGLVADGVVGPATWAVLDRAPVSGGGTSDPDPQPVDPAPVDPQPEPEPEPMPEPEPVSSRPTLRQGDRGEDVRYLQQLLRELGYQIVADGHFGPFTTSIVRQLQRANGLTADGVVGPATWELLESRVPVG
jgi:peptidoglycan hydrolase-like protein with peptidoglycan-binding domain